MSVWTETQDAFAACIDPSTRRIDAFKFVAACRDIARIYDALFMGMVASQLKGDILNSSATVEKASVKYKTYSLQDLIAQELKIHGRPVIRSDKASGTVGMLWAKRAVTFIVSYLDLLATRDDLTAPKCAQLTYETVLMKYHGWFTSKAISAVMNLAPSKDDIFKKLGLTSDPKKAIGEFVAVLNPVIGEIQRILDENECDFPDKV